MLSLLGDCVTEAPPPPPTQKVFGEAILSGDSMQATTRGISMVETVHNPTAMSCWVVSGKIAPFSMIFPAVALWESLS